MRKYVADERRRRIGRLDDRDLVRSVGTAHQRHHHVEHALPVLTRGRCSVVPLSTGEVVEKKRLLEDKGPRKSIETSRDKRRAAKSDMEDGVNTPIALPQHG